MMPLSMSGAGEAQIIKKIGGKGEVVVIEESFGVRITEIVNASRTGGK